MIIVYVLLAILLLRYYYSRFVPINTVPVHARVSNIRQTSNKQKTILTNYNQCKTNFIPPVPSFPSNSYTIGGKLSMQSNSISAIPFTCPYY